MPTLTFKVRPAAASPRAKLLGNWLTAIETLIPGDHCEVWYHNGNYGWWSEAVVVRNGGPGYWDLVTPAGTRQVYIEHIRCRGQKEAWPGSERHGK